MTRRAAVSQPTPHPPLVEGTVVEGYRLTFLGSGGMGVAYRGSKEGTDFFVKEVPTSAPSQVTALHQEKSLLERLEHPAIVRFQDFFEHDGYFYLVVDLIDGENLETFVGQPVAEARVRDWGLQLCDVLEYLHCQRPPIIYRDLKPANIMLEVDRLRLVDFGIARIHKPERDTDTHSMGSMQTASPEHYGGSQTDERSDVFTLGATLYLLMAGNAQLPNVAFQYPLLRQVRPEASAEWEAVLSRCLQVQPVDRFASMAELRSDLNRIGLSPSAPLATGYSKRRSLLAGALLIAATFAGGWLLRPRSTVPEADHGIAGPVFGHYPDGQRAVVSLGEDVGLFWVTPTRDFEALARAEQIEQRINRLYHQHCPLCGQLKLEPQGFRLGRLHAEGRDEVVVFYAHAHDGKFVEPPMLLATVDRALSQQLEQSPRSLGGYWRDLLRDVVLMSRRRAPRHTAMGQQLSAEFKAAIESMGAEGDIDNLRKVVQQLPAARALKVKFQQVPPDWKVEADQFEPSGGYQPLRS